MTYSEFEKAIALILDEWPSSFKSGKTKMLWLEVKDDHESVLRDAIEYVLKNSRQAPTVYELILLVKKYRRKNKKTEPCSTCGGSGMILIDSPGGSFARKCSCRSDRVQKQMGGDPWWNR